MRVLMSLPVFACMDSRRVRWGMLAQTLACPALSAWASWVTWPRWAGVLVATLVLAFVVEVRPACKSTQCDEMLSKLAK